MQDAFGRTINYLRLSLTDRCNFRCHYCMPSEGIKKLPHADMLSLEELFTVVHLLADRLGFSKLRVTGGEPLVRRGALPFMKSLGCIRSIDDLSLTTNAYHLAPLAADLRRAGFRRVNISLDTLRRDRFRAITGRDGLGQVLDGIAAARAAGFSPIKLNVVAMEETLDEALDLVAFGIEHQLEVRFIELMPVLGGANLRFVSTATIRERLADRYQLTPLETNRDSRGAAVVYNINGAQGRCGFISSMSHPFCRSCNRIRLRGDGRLKPCMASSVSHDLMPFIRPELRADDLCAYVEQAVRRKKLTRGDYEIDSMSAFGG